MKAHLPTTEEPTDALALEVWRLQALLQMTEAVSRAQTLAEIWEAALTCLQDTLGADRAAVLLVDPDGVMRFKAAHGLSRAYRSAVEGHSPWAANDPAPEPIIVPDTIEAPSLASFREAILAEGIRAIEFVPLIAGGRLIGKFMVYYDAPHAFDRLEVEVARKIASHIAFALERKRAEEGLRLYREIFVNSNDPIGIISLSGEYLEQNRAHEALTGSHISELSGKTPALHLGEEAFQEVARTLKERGAMRQELVFTDKSGTESSIELSAFAVCDDRGAPTCFVGIKRDVTERKRHEQARRFLVDASATLNSSLDLEATTSTVSRVAVPYLADAALLVLVDASLAITGVRVATTVPAWTATIEEFGRSETCARLARERLEESGRVGILDRPALASVGAEDEPLPEVRSIIAAPLATRGVPQGVLLLFACRQREPYGEAELALASDLCERAAMVLYNARVYAALRESDRSKDEFLAMLSHELRNPLAPILSAAELLRLPEITREAQVEAQAAIERQVRKLSRLVEDLLDVSRVTRGKIELRPEPVDLAAAIARSVEVTRSEIESRGHTLEISVPQSTMVLADPVRLEQIVSNLLHNAAKYTPSGGRIRVCAERDEKTARISVVDNGIGIPADRIPRIFDLFMQGQRALERGEGGLGIGLTLVRRLVEMHDGSVEARSEGPGKGSEFIVTLPVRTRLSEPLPPSGDTPMVKGERLQILIVDDNLDAAATLADLLEALGHQTSVAHEGEEALRVAAEVSPDVAFLDIGLPGMNGYEIARRLRASSGLAGISLIALSGYGPTEDPSLARDAGFEIHLVKPVDVQILQDVLAPKRPLRP